MLRSLLCKTEAMESQQHWSIDYDSTQQSMNEYNDESTQQSMKECIVRCTRHRCYVCGCARTQYPKMKFFTFPKDQARLDVWIKNGNLEELKGIPARSLHRKIVICKLHFERSAYSSDLQTRLSHDAVPTIFNITLEDLKPFEKPEDGIFQKMMKNSNPDTPRHTESSKSLVPLWMDNAVDKDPLAEEPEGHTKRFKLDISDEGAIYALSEVVNIHNIENICNAAPVSPSKPSKLDLCRICAQLQENLIGIFSAEGETRELESMINSILPIKVLENDHLPLQVCLPCISSLEAAHQLCKTSVSSNIILRDQFSQPEENSFDAETITTMQMPESAFNEDNASSDVQSISQSLQMAESSFKLVQNNNDQSNTNISIPDTAFRCDECNTILQSQLAYSRHHLMKHNRTVIRCQKCDIYFNERKQLKAHYAEIHHSESQRSEKFFCKHLVECGKFPRILKSCRAQAAQDRRLKRPKRTHYDCGKCKVRFPVEKHAEYRNHLLEHQRRERKERLRNSNIQCDYCDQKFVSDKSKLSHMLLFHKEYKPFVCKQCDKRYHTKMSFKNHMAAHSSSEAHLCDVCGSVFCTADLLYKHTKSKHKTKFCDFCQEQIGADIFRCHLDKKHFEERKHRCEICGHSFFFTKELDKHKLRHSSKTIYCYFCRKIFNFHESLHSHLKTYHQDHGTFSCPIKTCKKQFATTVEIIDHFKNHSQDDFPKPRIGERDKIKLLLCQFCDATYRHMNQYIIHLKKHNVANFVLVCNICKATFANENLLTNHLETHVEAYDFDCRHCIETFVTDTRRNVHEKMVHRKRGKVHQCPECPRAFSSGCALLEHSYVHSNERRFSCQYCGMKFKNRKDVRSHEVAQHEYVRHNCTVCSKEFKNVHDLKKHHFNVHLKENLYKCEHCDFDSNTKKVITEHMQLMHHLDDGDSSD